MSDEPPLSLRHEEPAREDGPASGSAGPTAGSAGPAATSAGLAELVVTLRGEVSAVQVALVDARGVLESRLAVLEDTLDSMVERIEALARDGAQTTTDRLAELLTGMKRLERLVTGGTGQPPETAELSSTDSTSSLDSGE